MKAIKNREYKLLIDLHEESTTNSELVAEAGEIFIVRYLTLNIENHSNACVVLQRPEFAESTDNDTMDLWIPLNVFENIFASVRKEEGF